MYQETPYLIRISRLGQYYGAEESDGR
jgi:hypothetical protein